MKEIPSIVTSTGKDAVRAVKQEMLDSKPQMIRLMTAFENYRACFSVEERVEMTNARIAAGVAARVIFSSNTPEVESQPLPEDYIWLSNISLPITVDVYIYNDIVTTIDMTDAEEPVVQTTNNTEYAKTMKALFDYIWHQHSSVT